MIARVWRGYARDDGAARYFEHVTGTVFPQLRAIPGHLAACVLRREVAGETEFVVTTVWESMAAIEAFAGADPSRAVVEPAGRQALTRFEDTVAHYEVAHCDPFDIPGAG